MCTCTGPMRRLRRVRARGRGVWCVSACGVWRVMGGWVCTRRAGSEVQVQVQMQMRPLAPPHTESRGRVGWAAAQVDGQRVLCWLGRRASVHQARPAATFTRDASGVARAAAGILVLLSTAAAAARNLPLPRSARPPALTATAGVNGVRGTGNSTLQGHSNWEGAPGLHAGEDTYRCRGCCSRPQSCCPCRSPPPQRTSACPVL